MGFSISAPIRGHKATPFSDERTHTRLNLVPLPTRRNAAPAELLPAGNSCRHNCVSSATTLLIRKSACPRTSGRPRTPIQAHLVRPLRPLPQPPARTHAHTHTDSLTHNYTYTHDRTHRHDDQFHPRDPSKQLRQRGCGIGLVGRGGGVCCARQQKTGRGQRDRGGSGSHTSSQLGFVRGSLRL